ncbi:hypothetical protein [Tunicatimonas pelagia]|uniref:hypothetical protein n=1 Tax=Tunicatimonas pelagia TaxID=931531 RepID=UPI002666628F|nr:hypothetical protein [Tunicatimonas pelagia]WKN42203.1 hypothetical protein P0M28_24505 [Tunicatimonas pelagia]WKN45321.1 hypothetical protein P0M28_10155 [Tunicatimonas pelagia]
MMIRFNQEENQYEVVIPLINGVQEVATYQEAIQAVVEVCKYHDSDVFINPHYAYQLINLMHVFSLDIWQMSAIEKTGVLERTTHFDTPPNITKLEEELATLKQLLQKKGVYNPTADMAQPASTCDAPLK